MPAAILNRGAVRDYRCSATTPGLLFAPSSARLEPMTKNTFLQLEKYRAKVAELEKEVALRQKKLLALPGRFGFRTVGDMIGALEAAASAAGGAFRKARVKSRRKRTKITAGVRANVKSLVGEGLTGAAVAKKLGISVASVQNIKKKLGLVRKTS